MRIVKGYINQRVWVVVGEFGAVYAEYFLVECRSYVTHHGLGVGIIMCVKHCIYTCATQILD